MRDEVVAGAQPKVWVEFRYILELRQDHEDLPPQGLGEDLGELQEGHRRQVLRTSKLSVQLKGNPKKKTPLYQPRGRIYFFFLFMWTYKHLIHFNGSNIKMFFFSLVLSLPSWHGFRVPFVLINLAFYTYYQMILWNVPSKGQMSVFYLGGGGDWAFLVSWTEHVLRRKYFNGKYVTNWI